MAKGRILNAVITNTILDIGDRGFLQGWVFVDHERGSQGFGGYTLYLPKDWGNHSTNINYAGHFITRVLQVAGAGSWEKLKGMTLRIDWEFSEIYGIGHIIEDDWFYPQDDFEKMKAHGD